MLNALVAGHRGRASRAAGGRVLKCAHPCACPGRLPNPVETVNTTYNGRTYVGIWLQKRLLSTAESGRIIYGIIYVCARSSTG
eukprot:1126690-Prymnesium_polylepis.2